MGEKGEREELEDGEMLQISVCREDIRLQHLRLGTEEEGERLEAGELVQHVAHRPSSQPGEKQRLGTINTKAVPVW